MAEGKSIESFVSFFNTKFEEGMKAIAKESAESKSTDLTKSPLKNTDPKDTRKDLVKKIQDLFVHMEIQDKMGESDYGSFGSRTEAAVKKYQKEKGKDETGEVNKELMDLIEKDIKEKEVKPLTW